MQPQHGFLHSNETDQKRTKTSLLDQKTWIGCVRFVSGSKLCIVSLTTRIGALNATFAWFFCTITKLMKTNQNITIGSKNMDWVRLFCFWPETVRRFVNDLNRCIKYNPDMVFCIVTKLTKTNQNITIGSENVDWVRSLRFWIEIVHRFVNDPNGCIKCNICMVFCTVTKLTKTNQNITIGSKN